MSEAKQAFTEAYERYRQYTESRSEANREAFHKAFRQAVIKYVQRHIPPASPIGTYVATDFVNDTFLKLDKEALLGREFQSAVDLQRYAITVIRNSIFDYLRSKKARLQNIDPRFLEDIPLVDPMGEAAFLHLDTMIRIEDAVKDLARFDPEAADIAWHFIYGVQDKEEIARDRAVSVRKISRALLKLRARLQTD